MIFRDQDPSQNGALDDLQGGKKEDPTVQEDLLIAEISTQWNEILAESKLVENSSDEDKKADLRLKIVFLGAKIISAMKNKEISGDDMNSLRTISQKATALHKRLL